MFYAVTRSPWKIESFITMALAVEAASRWGVPFDVHSASGAVVWVWESR